MESEDRSEFGEFYPVVQTASISLWGNFCDFLKKNFVSEGNLGVPGKEGLTEWLTL